MLEEKLAGWTGPSSDSEQEKQDRTERMIREAVDQHPAFDNCQLRVYAKGSYANNTNVRADSDVDIAVQCEEVVYWEESEPGAHPESKPYTGPWTPEKLREELVVALRKKFPGQVDTTGSTAIHIESNSSRVEADVVPAFDYKYYLSPGNFRSGSRIFTKDGDRLKNYPDQQLTNGRSKNKITNGRYKKAVRIMKRLENVMVDAQLHREVPSFFIECLVYNCPNHVLTRDTWTETIKDVIIHIWNELQGPEPNARRWFEPNGYKYLFHDSQPWTRQDGRDFAKAAWNYLGFA